MKGFRLIATADGRADIDLNTKCVDDNGVLLSALTLLLRTWRGEWRGDRRMGPDMSFLQLGGTQDDIRRTIETDLTEQLSRVSGFALDTVTATPPRTGSGSRIWSILVDGTNAETGSAVTLTEVLAV